MTFDEFIAKWKGKPVDLHACSESGFVHSLMLCPAYYLKVLYSIISLVVVNVVNYLIRSQESSKMFFHNKSMFGHSIKSGVGMIGGINANIPIRFDKPAAFPVIVKFAFVHRISTIVRAETSFQRLITSKLFPTTFTAFNTFTRFIVTSPTAMSGLIRGWSLKFHLTDFAYKFHGVEIIRHSLHGGNN